MTTVIANEREATQLMNIERAPWLHRALFYFYELDCFAVARKDGNFHP
jgi:hypothetical protein